ncbi:MAG TPA: hypothetical protein PL110_08905 [Candidatus Eremiobacteraeota bacterium]|nr:hypothetical protein [Candidatus Eremiobacteraeota bacterium]
MDDMLISKISPSILSRREARLNKVQNLVEVAEKSINAISLLPPDRQEALNSFYNILLCDIYNLKEISIPLSLSSIQDRTGKASIEEITATKTIYPDGTEAYISRNQEEGQIKSFTKWKDGTKVFRVSKSDMPVNIENISLNSVRKELESFLNYFTEKHSSVLKPEDIIKNGLIINYCNFPDIFSLLQEELSKYINSGEVVDELLSGVDNIKQRERLYNNGILELVVNTPLYKQILFSDLNKNFEYRHTVYNDGKDKKSLNYNDGTSIESYVNNKTGERKLKTKFNNMALKYRSSGDAKMSLAELDYGKGTVSKILSGENKFLIEYRDKLNRFYSRGEIFEDNSLKFTWNEEGFKEKVVRFFPCGSGKLKEIDNSGKTKEFSWTPDKEIMYVEEKMPNENLNKTYFYKNGIVRKQKYFSDGHSIDMLSYPDNIIKKIYTYPDNTREVLTTFPRGESRRTVRYADGSILSELKYSDKSMKIGKLLSNGTVSLQRVWANGIKEEALCWPQLHKGSIDTIFPSGEREKKIFNPDGSCDRHIYTGEDTQLTHIPGEFYSHKLQGLPFFNRLASSLEHLKLLKNPFHNLLLIMDPHIWILFLIGGIRDELKVTSLDEKISLKKSDIISEKKTHRVLKKPVYIEFTAGFEIISEEMKGRHL